MPLPSRYLLIGEFPSEARLPDGERTATTNLADAIPLLQQDYQAVILSPSVATSIWQANQVLEHLDQGVALLDLNGVVTSANPYFRSCCPVEPVGKPYLEALAVQHVASEVPDPFAAAREGHPTVVRLARPDSLRHPYLHLSLKRVCDTNNMPQFLVAFVRNVSEEVEQQRKLDALHLAGLEMSRLDADQIAEMNIPTRVELLKKNLKRYIHDLLHYDIIEVRLLDRRTGQLRPLLEEGMSKEAAQRVLFAQSTGNGVTGYVAATGRSYVCPDASNDPLYLEGATGARSSMTVPLKYHEEVVGTLNVESPRLDGFGSEDLQFTELFSKEIALALHTLDLLSAQQSCTANQSIDLVNREVALPVDEILAAASQLLQKFGDQDEAAQQLARIVQGARTMKQNILKVGQDLLANEGTAMPGELPLQGKRVLIIDSDERIRRTAHLMYERLGACVETSGTALDGIAMLQEYPFDAVLMEIKPIDLGGYETYRRLRAARPSAAISMTTGFGYDSAHSIVKARADGMRYVLFKPFRQDQLLKAVLDAAPAEPQVANGKPA